MIVTVDTDGVVIALCAYWGLNVTELWIEFGTGKDRRWLPVHSYTELPGERVSRAVIFWYALTGCDTVSQLRGHSKPTACKAWKTFPEVTDTFIKLSRSGENSTEDFEMIEHFVVLMYDRTCPHKTADKFRKYFFHIDESYNAVQMDNCPSTRDDLLQHVRRGMSHSDIWARRMILSEADQNLADSGWFVDGEDEQ